MAESSSALAKAAQDGPDATLGDFSLNETFSGDAPLSKEAQEVAIEYLRRSEQIQIERLQCIADGAVLGAEQVQDVRLDLLEQGPEVNTTMVIMDLFIGLLLDSSLAGVVMKAFANSTVKRLVIRDRSLYIGEMRNVRELAKSTRKLRSEAYLKQVLSADMRAKDYLASAEKWRRVGEWASNSDRAKDVTATGKAMKGAAKANYGTKGLRVEGDTPGVSLLGSVLEFVSVNRLRVRQQYLRMETLMRVVDMTGDDARAFLLLAEFQPSPAPLKYIRDRCKLLFEAIIWAGIFGFDTERRKLAAGNLLSHDRLQGIDDRLAKYWVTRFGVDVERWVSEMGDQARRNRGLDAIPDWKAAPFIAQLGFIEDYFRSLLAALPQSLDSAGALASSARQP